MTLGQQSIVRDGAKLAQVRAAHMELLKLAQAGDLNGAPEFTLRAPGRQSCTVSAECSVLSCLPMTGLPALGRQATASCMSVLPQHASWNFHLLQAWWIEDPWLAPSAAELCTCSLHVAGTCPARVDGTCSGRRHAYGDLPK